jgi:cystathionine beta-lyase/cystathionine gamma-synthase
LPARLERITKTTHEVIEYLKSNPLVDDVIFPFDENFPQYELAKQQMSGACGLFAFSIKANDVETVEMFCDSLQHILMAVSWGGYESLIIPGCASIKKSFFNKNNINHRRLRMYVGLEDAHYIISDLKQAFEKINY